MNVHVIHYNDERGDLVEIDWFCDHHCMIHVLIDLGVEWEAYVADEKPINVGVCHGTVSYGGWPGGEETDYDVFCAHCGEQLWSGLEVKV